MLTKIFTVLLTVSILVMAFLTFYSWSWLGSIGAPASAVTGYEYHAGISWPILWLTATVLLVLANAILWVSGRAWALWVTLIYFQIFVLLRAFWLDPALLAFKNNVGLAEETFTIRPIMAAFLTIIAAAIVFFDQFLVLRLREKTYPKAQIEAVEVEKSGSETDRAMKNSRPEGTRNLRKNGRDD
jgi:hypothetical protein